MVFESFKTAKKNSYIKKGIINDESLRRFVPRRYKDFSTPGSLSLLVPEGDGIEMGVVSELLSLDERKNKDRKYIVAKLRELSSGEMYNATFMNMYNAVGYLSQFIGHPIAVLGKFKRSGMFGCSVMNPTLHHEPAKAFKIYPVYSKIQRVSEASFTSDIESALLEKETDTIPEGARRYLDVSEINEALFRAHHPTTIQDIQSATTRLDADSLIYLNLKLLDTIHTEVSPFIYKSRLRMDDMIKNLPYSLTNDQAGAIDSLADKAMSGKVIDALVQGDVGCGKTIIAFALMTLTAENGYQAVLMAPTQVLAQQHHEGLREIADDDEIAYLYGVMKKKEKDEQLLKIKDGRAKFIVGTQALLGKGVEYNNLALMIADEEHRFGVEQREKLSSGCIHTVTMSATPIPRSYVQAVYGEMTEAIQITEKPAGRLETITYYNPSMDNKLKNFIYSFLKSGSQVYVVCPMKEEADEDSTMEGCASVDEIFRQMQIDFTPHGFTIGCVTGSTPSDEKDAVLSAFKDGSLNILVSTTVVEVGVNVPNANMMIIMNAERFGLATMHQLRGRVGRGNSQGYCVLVSSSMNKRIEAMCRTTDGFKIAEEDFLERRSGDLIGMEQSGRNKLVETMFANPELNRKCKEVAKSMYGSDNAKEHIRIFESMGF